MWQSVPERRTGSMLMHSKLNKNYTLCMANKKYENSSQGQRSRSNVTNFQSHLPSYIDFRPVYSSRDFVRTDTQPPRPHLITDDGLE